EAGWQRGDRVTRVEFQYRTEVLQALGVHTLEDYFASEDKLWAYGTQTWFSLRVPKDDRKSRWAIDLRWQVVQQVAFFGRVEAPRKRDRRRGGVSVGQARGAVLSLLAGGGRLDRIFSCPNRPEGTSVVAGEERHAATWVREHYRAYFRDAATL